MFEDSIGGVYRDWLVKLSSRWPPGAPISNRQTLNGVVDDDDDGDDGSICQNRLSFLVAYSSRLDSNRIIDAVS